MNMLEVKIEDGKIYSFIRDKWLVCTPEEEVRQNFVCVLVNHFGYKIEQLGEEIQVNNSLRGQGQARADIIVWKSKEDKINEKSAFIVVECKAENVKIHEEDYYQGYNYAAWAGASFFVTTNNRETKYFNIDKTMMPKKLEEIVTIPPADEADNDKRVKEILSQTKTFSRE
ncbi:MAG: type I restriction enzyme HsdR N-terminal domain-containing protein, partial [Clostridia bacterium]|nr:type I restriction enzyme HsdR N-terminal domain-containing protein [Clostridia bacterium]